MMRTRRLLLLVLVLILTGFAWQQREPAFVVVNFPAVTTVDGFSRLSVFFTITDSNGRAVEVNNIESATMQLFGDATVYPAVVEKPSTPFYVVLLLDASGSMGAALEDMKTAAKSALNSAPPEARFAIVQFNENPPTVILGFTNNIGQAQAAIDRVQVDPNKGTCLFDAIRDSINLIDAEVQSPEERRAVIAFTDGKDQLRIGDDTPCSLSTYDDIVTLGRTPGRPTAVHTIGMSGATGEISASELRGLAEETRGFSAIGDQTTLNSLFQEIITSLNNQWVARTDICAPAGLHKVTMGIKLRDIQSPFTTTFDFNSTGDPALCGLLGPPRCEAQALNFDPPNERYTLALTCGNLGDSDRLLVSVEDERRGLQIGQDYVFNNPADTELIELSTAGLEAGQEYIIRVRALDEAGNLLENEEGETTLTVKQFLHDPPPLPPLELVIASVNPDFENDRLVINLQLPDQDVSRLKGYRGFINREGTERVADLGPSELNGLQIVEVLPSAFITDAGQFEYSLTLQAIDSEGVEGPPAVIEFRPIPPEPPGFFSRLFGGLSQNPWIAGSIVAIVLAVAGWFFIQRRQQHEQAAATPAPPVNQTMYSAAPLLEQDFEPEFDLEDQQFTMVDTSLEGLSEEDPFATEMYLEPATSEPRLRIRIIDTLRTDLVNNEKIARAFPFTIGRDGCDMNIPGDGRVSRRHLVVDRLGQDFTLTDHSRNGSYINDERLAEGVPHPLLGGRVTIRLGSRTILEIERL